jgi:multiple sugar transport system substrate-binding protein
MKILLCKNFIPMSHSKMNSNGCTGHYKYLNSENEATANTYRLKVVNKFKGEVVQTNVRLNHIHLIAEASNMIASQWYIKLQRIWQRPKFFLFGLGLLIACLILAVLCWTLLSNLTRSPSNNVTLSFVVPDGEAPYWQTLIEEFEANHPRIEIDLVNLRNKDATKPAIKPQDSIAVKKQYIDSFYEKNSVYDLVFSDVIWVPEFAEKGWIKELPMKLNNPELKNFISDDVKGGTYQKKLYRMPVRSNIGWLYYRADLLENAKLEPPETFEDLINISQKLQAQAKGPRWGYLWQGRQAEALSAMFVEVLHGYGGFWINPETLEVGLDRDEAIKAVNFLRNTMFEEKVEKKPISPETLTTYREDETNDLFSEGEGDAIFLRNWLYGKLLANQTDSDSSVRKKIGLKPMIYSPGYTSGGCQGGWGLGIAHNTKHAEEAWQAVQFFSSAAAQRKLFLAGSDGLPTRRELFKDPQLVKRNSYYPAMLDFLENQEPHPIVFRPAIPQYAQATCILQKYLHTALAKKYSNVEQKMKDAASDTRILLKTSGGELKEKSCFFNNREQTSSD